MTINGQVLAALFAGGLAGSVFTWIVNRPAPAETQYRITTTSLGANAAVKSVVPNLRIQVDGEDVPVVHTHVVEFTTTSGYATELETALVFNHAIRLFGRIGAEAPSPLQRITCKQLEAGAQCTMGPLVEGKSTFRVSLATDEASPPKVMSVAKNVKLVDASVGSASPNVFDRVLSTGGTAAVVVIVAAALLGVFLGLRLVRRPKSQAQGGASVEAKQGTQV